MIRLLLPVALALAIVSATGGAGHAQPPASCGRTPMWEPSITRAAFTCLKDAYLGGCRPTQAVFTTDAGTERIIERVRLYPVGRRCEGDVEAATVPPGGVDEQPLARCGGVRLATPRALNLVDCTADRWVVVLGYCPPDDPHATPSPDARLYLC